MLKIKTWTTVVYAHKFYTKNMGRSMVWTNSGLFYYYIYYVFFAKLWQTDRLQVEHFNVIMKKVFCLITNCPCLFLTQSFSIKPNTPLFNRCAKCNACCSKHQTIVVIIIIRKLTKTGRTADSPWTLYVCEQ
jgi:hypothetical protein